MIFVLYNIYINNNKKSRKYNIYLKNNKKLLQKLE